MTAPAVALAAVRERIVVAARAAGREPDAVRLVAVSKSQPAAAVEAAFAAGQRAFGENRAQELVAKAAEVVAATDAEETARAEWHFIGRLQRNKIRSLSRFVHRWHSIDRADFAPDLARYTPAVPILVQVNVAGDEHKGGCAPGGTEAVVDALRHAGLVVDGLMTVPPEFEDPRPHFAALRRLAEGLGLPELSMGMTGDFEAAIAEGATIVRVGGAIFGARAPARAP